MFSINFFDKIKKDLEKDTNFLKEISNQINDKNLISSEILKLFDSTWDKTILHFAIETNNSNLIHLLVDRNSSNNNFIDEKIKEQRDINRYRLINVFFKKNNIDFN